MFLLVLFRVVLVSVIFLFNDIFVMIVIHRTINNNKTGRVFVFFQRGHAIFQLVVVGFIIIIIIFLHSLLLLAFTLILEFDRKYQLNLNAGYMQSQFYIYFIKSANITAYQAV